MENKERLKAMLGYELKFIEDYILKIESEVNILVSDIRTVKNYFNNLKCTLSEMEEDKSEDKALIPKDAKYKNSAEDMMLVSDTRLYLLSRPYKLGDKVGRCLGIHTFPGTIVFENRYFGKGDILAINSRDFLMLITDEPTIPTNREAYDNKTVYVYNYTIMSEDLTMVPVEGETYYNLLTK